MGRWTAECGSSASFWTVDGTVDQLPRYGQYAFEHIEGSMSIYFSRSVVVYGYTKSDDNLE